MPPSARAATTFYLDSDWNGTQSGTASQPWKYLSSSAWSSVNSALGSGDVTVYFSAREASSDTDDVYDTNGDGAQDGIDLTLRTDPGSGVLTLDGNSKYNTSDSSPNWVSYSGNSRSRVRYVTAQNSSHTKYSNITLHGLHVATSDANKQIAIAGDNWIVENCICEHTSSATDGPGVYLIPTADSAHEGSSAYITRCNNIIIRNNIIHDSYGEAMYIGGGGVMDGTAAAGYPSHSNVTIEGNTIYNAGSRGAQGDGIDVKGGIQNLTIRANEIYNINSTAGVRAIVVQGQSSGASQTTVIERNRIHDCTGIEDGAIAVVDSWGIPQGVSVRNNVIYKVNAVGIKVYNSQDTAGIYNNTLSACGGVGIQAYPAVSVMNNLVFANNGGGSQVSLGSGSSCDYNAYSGTWGYASAGSSSMNLSSTDLNNTVMSASSGNLALKSTAVVIGKAKVMSGYSNDVMNNARGTSWDIGAYEYGASPAGSIAPAAITTALNNATLSVSSSTGAPDRTRVLEAQAMTASAAANSASTDANPSYVVWVEDALPAGAQPGADGGDAWTWSSANPAPVSGSQTHQSALAGALHEHYFDGATESLSVDAGDQLFAYVYLDASNPPSEVMLQWSDGTWEHRAYWGANNIPSGVNATASQYYMGALPATGQWVRLEVPASAVALEGRTVTGMAFSLYGGQAFWDAAGKTSAAQ